MIVPVPQPQSRTIVSGRRCGNRCGSQINDGSMPIPGRSLRHEACDEVGRVEGDRNALAASHPLAFPLGRSCAQRGAAGPADGELVPVEHLVNGVSIGQCEAVERVAYFHRRTRQPRCDN